MPRGRSDRKCGQTRGEAGFHDCGHPGKGNMYAITKAPEGSHLGKGHRDWVRTAFRICTGSDITYILKASPKTSMAFGLLRKAWTWGSSEECVSTGPGAGMSLATALSKPLGMASPFQREGALLVFSHTGSGPFFPLPP